MIGLLAIELLILTGVISLAQAEISETTTLHGKITYHGPVPSMEPEPITKDIEVCGQARDQTPIVMSPNGGLQHVIVSVNDLRGTNTAKLNPLVLKNDHCRFLQHVSSASIKQSLEVQNLDPILHNTHIRTENRAFFNVVLLPQSKGIKKVMKKPGPMTIACNKHPFMLGHIHVFDHPYHTVTDTEGTFAIHNLPPGTHTLSFWHETLGTMQQTVTLPQKSGTTLNIEFPAP